MKKIIVIGITILFLFGAVGIVLAGENSYSKRPITEKYESWKIGPVEPLRVPEPATIVYLASGLAGIAIAWRGLKNKKK